MTGQNKRYPSGKVYDVIVVEILPTGAGPVRVLAAALPADEAASFETAELAHRTRNEILSCQPGGLYRDGDVWGGVLRRRDGEDTVSSGATDRS